MFNAKYIFISTAGLFQGPGQSTSPRNKRSRFFLCRNAPSANSMFDLNILKLSFILKEMK